MQEKIISILCEVKDESALIETLNGGSDIINEVGLNSLQMINFILRVEDEFGIEVDFEELDITDLGSIDSFCNYISERM